MIMKNAEKLVKLNKSELHWKIQCRLHTDNLQTDNPSTIVRSNINPIYNRAQTKRKHFG